MTFFAFGNMTAGDLVRFFDGVAVWSGHPAAIHDDPDDPAVRSTSSPDSADDTPLERVICGQAGNRPVGTTIRGQAGITLMNRSDRWNSAPFDPARNSER
jgi:hypothetical protein